MYEFSHSQGHEPTSYRPRSPAMSAHLAFVDARGCCGVVLVVTLRRMMEMDDEIAIVRNDRPVEGDGSDAAPIPEGAPLAERWDVRLPVIGVDSREQLAHQRQRPEMAAPRLAAAGRIAPHNQGPAAVAEIAGIAAVLRNLPQAGQANAVRMH